MPRQTRRDVRKTCLGVLGGASDTMCAQLAVVSRGHLPCGKASGIGGGL